MTSKPWILYSYAWMPFPRRVTIYLRERGIPNSLVTIVPISLPPTPTTFPAGIPAPPAGSLPMLMVPSSSSSTISISDKNPADGTIYIRQSLAIIQYIEEHCEQGLDGFPRLPSMRGSNILERARDVELLGLADELLVGWNPVRMFGSGAGTVRLPEVARTMLEWEHRVLQTIEDGWFSDRDFSYLRASSSSAPQAQNGGEKEENRGREVKKPTIAEIVLFQFLEFVDDCYGVNLTKTEGGKVVVDVYGREVVREYKKLREFYEAFRTRESARREEGMGEVPPEKALKSMRDWSEGVF